MRWCPSPSPTDLPGRGPPGWGSCLRVMPAGHAWGEPRSDALDSNSWAVRTLLRPSRSERSSRARVARSPERQRSFRRVGRALGWSASNLCRLSGESCGIVIASRRRRSRDPDSGPPAPASRSGSLAASPGGMSRCRGASSCVRTGPAPELSRTARHRSDSDPSPAGRYGIGDARIFGSRSQPAAPPEHTESRSTRREHAVKSQQ